MVKSTWSLGFYEFSGVLLANYKFDFIINIDRVDSKCILLWINALYVISSCYLVYTSSFLTNCLSIVAVSSEHRAYPMLESKCNYKKWFTIQNYILIILLYYILCPLGWHWFLVASSWLQPRFASLLLHHLQALQLNWSFSMQVPALVLDCEPDIDLNKDIEAKRQ